MDNDQNWYRQLAALVLLSASRAAVDFITNPNSREDAGKQLRDAIRQDRLRRRRQGDHRRIDGLASNSKGRLNETIDTLRDTSVDAVEEAKTKAAERLGTSQKKKGKKMRFLFALILGGIIAYFVLDEQRRDDLLDRLTGASGPIQQIRLEPVSTTASASGAPLRRPSSALARRRRVRATSSAALAERIAHPQKCTVADTSQGA